MYEYRQIIFLMREGKSDRQIAASKLVGRLKAKHIRQVANLQGWLSADAPLPDDNALAQVLGSNKHSPAVSKCERYAQQIEKWANQGVSASVIYQVLSEQYGFDGSYNSVQRFVQKRKAQDKNVTIILDFKPGKSAQVDFGKGPIIDDELTGKPVSSWFFVMTLCWSRHQYAELVRNQNVETWLNCHRHAFEFFGGVPGEMIIDNPKCAITKSCYHEPTVQRSYGEYAQRYGFMISPCPVRDPQKKGRVEAGVKYIKRNFLPLRQFSSFSDGNQQLKAWIIETAGQRVHGTTHQQPYTQFIEVERTLLKPLPAVPPELCFWQKVRLYRDCHVRFEKCLYSAPYTLVGTTLWLSAAQNCIKIYDEHHLVALHTRAHRPGERRTIAQHLPLNKRCFIEHDAHWCLAQAQMIGPHCLKVAEGLLQNKVINQLRAAQGLIYLKSKYGKSRLEHASHRALVFQAPNYKTIRAILAKGLDSALFPEDEAFARLAKIYQGQGKYIRQDITLTH